MNERIRELAIQAEGTKKHVPAVWQFYDHELEKFAELIVKECINVVQNLPPGYADYRNQIEDAFRRDCVAMIRKSFGVEE